MEASGKKVCSKSGNVNGRQKLPRQPGLILNERHPPGGVVCEEIGWRMKPSLDTNGSSYRGV